MRKVKREKENSPGGRRNQKERRNWEKDIEIIHMSIHDLFQLNILSYYIIFSFS